MGEFRPDPTPADLQAQYARHTYQDKPKTPTWKPESDNVPVPQMDPGRREELIGSLAQSTRANVLNEAKDIVTKSRQDTHGRPEDTFQRIADLWNAYLQPAGDHGGDRVLSATDVSMLLVLLKIARQAGNPNNKDNYVDLAGYAACAAELELH